MVRSLTRRQIEVLDLVAHGFTTKEIAVRLGVSDATVKFHVTSALRTLGARSRTEAVAIAITSCQLPGTLAPNASSDVPPGSPDSPAESQNSRDV